MSAIHLGHLLGRAAPATLHIPAGEGFQLTCIGATGSGKTNTLYQIIEGIPAKRPIFIADPEQDFLPLRRHLDFVIVGKNRDLPADPGIAETLARRWLETGFNLIFDAFEEKKDRREAFLRNFLMALHDVPRNLWREATLILDELDTWAPEKGVSESLCTEACAAASKRFRKRGFDLVLATQRPAEVNKTVISGSRNMLIGLANLDTDVKRSLSFLGFTEKEDRESYRDLQRGEFFGRGPDLGLRRPEKILIARSKLYQPQALGKRASADAIPSTDQVKKLLAELKDLPAEVTQEIKDRAGLERRIRELETQLEKKTGQELSGLKEQEYRLFINEQKRVIEQHKSIIQSAQAALSQAMKSLDAPLTMVIRPNPIQTVPPAAPLVRPPQPQRAVPAARSESPKSLSRPARLILNLLLAKEGETLTRAQVAGWTQYSITSSSFSNALSELRTGGWLEGSGDALRFPEEISREAAVAEVGTDYNPNIDFSLEAWLPKLSAPARAMLKYLQTHVGHCSKETLCEMTGYSLTSSSFSNGLSELCSKKLCERVSGGIRINPEILQ
jgi:hypothetical protein